MECSPHQTHQQFMVSDGAVRVRSVQCGMRRASPSEASAWGRLLLFLFRMSNTSCETRRNSRLFIPQICIDLPTGHQLSRSTSPPHQEPIRLLGQRAFPPP